jgi:toxin ParE1/3/4
MTIKFSKKASTDIEAIWKFTFERWSKEQADRYVNLLFDEIDYISKQPFSGVDIGATRQNYRQSKVKSHMIFYKIQPNEHKITIIRVLHEVMDLNGKLR